MIILFQNILFLKEFLACNGFFGLFTKVKKGSGNSLWYTHFLHDFPIKMFLIWYSINGQSFNVIPFFILKISNKMFFKFIFRQLMTCKLEDLSWISSKLMADRKKKERKMEIQNFKYLENKKSFLDEIKNMLRSFWRTIIW